MLKLAQILHIARCTEKNFMRLKKSSQNYEKACYTKNFRFSKLCDVFQCPPPLKQSFRQVAKIFDFSFRFITKHESLRVFAMLKPSKPLGPTKLPAWAFSDVSVVLARPLTKLINAYLKEKKFPSEIKLANLIPLYKKGKIDNSKNYSPISFALTISRTFEKQYKALMEDYLRAK